MRMVQRNDLWNLTVKNLTMRTKIQRSERGRKPPDYYGEWVAVATNQTTEPKTAKYVLFSSDKAK